MVNASGEGSMDDFESGGEWQLIEIPVVRNVIKYDCCSSAYTDVTYTVVLEVFTVDLSSSCITWTVVGTD